MPSELISLQNKVTQLENEALSYQKAMDELHHRIDIQDATNEILNISLMPVSLEEQMESILLLVLNISWLALEGKGCIFLTDEQGQGLNMIAHHNLGQSLLTMCKQVPFGSCLCGKAAIDQTLIFRNCIDKDHHYHPEGMQPHGHYNSGLFFPEEKL